MVIENKELRCSCLASAYGCYSFEYEVTQMESSYQVKYPKSNYDSSSKDQAPLLLGDSNKYSKEIEKAVAKYLSDNKKFNKRKVKVIETCRNGITEDIEVILLDKKAIIE